MAEDKFGISILLPTRGRTEQLKRSVKSLLDLADKNQEIEWLFGFDSDDQDSREYAEKNVMPLIDKKGGTYTIMEFPPLGYGRLNDYVNALAHQSVGDWMVFWNDDAVMKSKGWDTVIRSYTGKFVLQAFDTHNKHPYSIFPIVPRAWLEIIGHLSKHQLNDAWLSQIAWLLDIVERIDVVVDHERFDLTGQNGDSTYKSRQIFEGRPNDPRDFNYVTFRQERLKEAVAIANYLIKQGHSMDYFKDVLGGKRTAWDKMIEADVNKHMAQFPMNTAVPK